MNDKVNLEAMFARLDGPYQPAIVGYLNDYMLLIEPDGTVNTGDAGGALTAEPRILEL